MAAVNITQKGPSGTIQYIEGSLFNKKTCEFYWEFSGGNVIATVWFPAGDKWDAKYPWAAGRRSEIMEFVAAEVRKQKAPSSKIQWEDDRFHLTGG